jgi:hypothetical protein
VTHTKIYGADLPGRHHLLSLWRWINTEWGLLRCNKIFESLNTVLWYHIVFRLEKPTLWYGVSLIHLAVCLTTGPKRALHTVRSRASSFRCEYPLPSLRSPSSFLHLLLRLPVTSIPPFIFPSITAVEDSFNRLPRQVIEGKIKEGIWSLT